MRKIFNEINFKSKALARVFVGLFFYLFDSLLLFSLKRNDVSNEIDVLIIRLDNIGDFLLWAGQIDTLRNLYPESKYRLILLVNKACKDLVPIHKFNKIIYVDRKKFVSSFLYRIFLLKDVAINNYHTVINPVYSRGFYFEDSIVRFANSNIKLGIDGDLTNSEPTLEWISRHFYTQLFRIKESSELEINAAFMRKIGATDCKPSLAEIDLKNKLYEISKTPYFVIIPGGSWTKKCWPADNFAELISKIQFKYGLHGVICGSLSEKKLAANINSSLTLPLEDLTGKTSLLELTSILKSAHLIITNDNGAAHLSVLGNVSSICILGGGHYNRFFPYPVKFNNQSMSICNFKMDCYGCDWKCIYPLKDGKLPCIANISIDSVWQEAQLLIDNNLSKPHD